MKKSIILKSIIFVLTLIMLGCNFNLIHAIYLLEGIETTGRMLGIAILLTLDVIFVNEARRVMMCKKNKLHILLIFFILIYGTISLLTSLYIKSIYSKIENMNKAEVTYASVILALKDSEKTQVSSLTTIGMIDDETSIDGYQLPTEYISNNNVSATVKYYHGYGELVDALYSKEIDSIFIAGNYGGMFTEHETYKNITKDTIIIETYQKTMEKDEQIVTKNLLDEPFTVLLIGVDSHLEGINSGTGNGDALILVTFNPTTLSATMLSIPRDSYVKQACFRDNVENKLTHAAWGGTGCIIKTIENFLDVSIDYYVKINFKGVVQLVDALDGITVNVPKDICTNSSSRSGKVCVSKGVQTLNGEQALVLARNRYDFAHGDLDRGLNQQTVIEGIVNSSKNITSLSDVSNILDIVSNNIDTNLTTNQILSSYNLLKKILLNVKGKSVINIQKLYLNGSGQTIFDEGMNMPLWNYILYPDSVKVVTKAMKENLGLVEPEMIKEFSYSIKNQYTQAFIGKDVYGASGQYKLLPDFTSYTQEKAISWLNSNGFSFEIETYEDTENKYKDGQIISQSIPALKRLDKISNKKITLKIAKVITPDPIDDQPLDDNKNTD